MRTVYKITLLVLAFSILTTYAQENISPGVSQVDWDAIQSQVTSLLGATYLVSDIVNVDSAIGNRIVSDGALTDPYHTLSHCYIFTVNETTETTSYLHGVIGIYKSGTIIWNSGASINSTSCVGSSITASRDLNDDGKVEIITTWFEGAKGDIELLWIFTWDGSNGNIINAISGQNESVLISASSAFDYIDIDGNSIYEISGLWYNNENDDNMQKIIYSWNGSQYGKWANIPPPLPSGFYPRDKVDASIKAVVKNIGPMFSYHYELQNKPSSKQTINELFLDTSPDTIENFRSPYRWDIGSVNGKCLGWWADAGFDRFINPGKGDTSFYFETCCLPAIVTSIVRGQNGSWIEIFGDSVEYTLDQWYDEAKSNSFKVTTVGPANPSLPFVPLNFLDTLSSYTTQSRTLGWIKDEATANKYLGYFASAKTSLGQNNTVSARTTLQQVLQDANTDSTSLLTSEAYALIRYNTEYLLAQLPSTPQPGLFVKLVNSAGSLLTTGTLQYRDSTWKDATNNNDGTFTINTNRKKLNLRMTYEYGTQTKSNVIVGTDTVTFQTVNTQIQLKNSQGGFIDTGVVQYYAGAWRNFGTTTSGIAAKELLPVKYTFRLTYNSASISKAQNIDSNATVVFQTVPAKVQLQASTGAPLDTGIVQYYSEGWRDFGTTTNGVAIKELLPIKYTFKMTYDNASNEKKQNIDSNAIVVFQTVNAIVQLKNSAGNFIDQGTVQYNAGGWKDFGITSNGSVHKELLPAKYNFKMTYASASKNQAQDLDSNTIVVFQTSNVSVQLKSSQGTPLDTGVVQYNAGGWKDFGTTVNGITNKELLPVKYTFRITYGYANNEKAQNTDSNAVVTFQTVNAAVQLQNSQGSLMDTGTVQYNAGGWKNFGTTANGIASKELLANQYNFRMTYAFANKDKQQDIGTNPIIVFQTINTIVQLQNSQGISLDTGTVQYNAGGWKNFGTTTNGMASKELLANKYNFRMTYAFVNNDKAQNLDSSNIVNFSTVLCIVRVTNSSGQLLSNAIVTYNAGGWKPFGTTVNGITTKELLPANMTFRVQSGKTTQTKAQDITTNPNVEISLP